MEPDQINPDAAQSWQGALSPRLVARLARPLVRPGVIAPGLGRSIIARMQHTGAHMPLLDRALQRLRSVDDPQAGRAPIVYARPAPAASPPADATAQSAAPPAPAVTRSVVQPMLARQVADDAPPQPVARASAAPLLVQASAWVAASPADRSGALLQATSGARGPERPVSTLPQPLSAQGRAEPERSRGLSALPLGERAAGESGPAEASVAATAAATGGASPVPPPAIQAAAEAAAPPLPRVEPLAAGGDEPVRIVLPPGRRVARRVAETPPIAAAPLAIQRAAETPPLAAAPLAIQRAAPADAAAPPELPLAQRPPSAAPAPGATALPLEVPVAAPQQPAPSAVAPLWPTPRALPVVGALARPAAPLPPVAVVQRRSAAGPPASSWPAWAAAEAAPVARPVIAALRGTPPSAAAPPPLGLRAAGAAAGAQPAPVIQRAADPPTIQAAAAPAAAPPSAAGGEAAPAPDVNVIASEVYELLVRRIASERERKGR